MATSPKLTYVDFPPACLDEGGVFSKPKFERFPVVMQRANEWLLRNPHIHVVTCESFEARAQEWKLPGIDVEKMIIKERPKGVMMYVRGLRLWVCHKEPSEPEQIGCLNTVPGCTSPGGFFDRPEFEDLGVVLNSANGHLRQSPVPGEILTIETQEVKFSEYHQAVDPDKSVWIENVQHPRGYLNIIRIFYLKSSQPRMEEIGFADFAPTCLQAREGIGERSQFEPFRNLVQKAQVWIQQHEGSLRVTNIQSVDVKLKHASAAGGHLDTHRSFYTEKSGRRTYYIRILRVAYVIPQDGLGIPNEYNIRNLNYKTFKPAQLVSSVDGGKFETMSQTIQRAIAYLRHTGNSRMISAETFTVRLIHGNQHGNDEQTYTWNSVRYEAYLLCVRVYFDGVFQPPQNPRDLGPSLPQVEDGDCCTIL